MKIQNNKTKTATTIISALVIVLLMLLPMTGLPMVNAQPDSGQPQIINHMGPPGPLKGVKIIPPPHLSAAQEQKVIPPGVERPIGAKSVADQKVCDASAGTRSGQFTCVVIPSYDAQSTWAEGPVIYPQGSGYSSYSGIGASPYISSLGSTSLNTNATHVVVTVNLVDSSNHKWGLQNTIDWGKDTYCGVSSYQEAIWLYDITGNTFYRYYHCISSPVGTQPNLEIYYDTSTAEWTFLMADGTTHPITDISAPGSDYTAIDGVTSAASEKQFPVLLESEDTAASDFNNFEIDMYGSSILYKGSWVFGGTGTNTVNFPAWSYYSGNSTVYGGSNWDIKTGGYLNSPTSVGYEGNTENSIYGPGISISESGYDNYWYCVQCGGTIKVQPTNPGTGYLYAAGYTRLW